ncbi:MAG: ECF-type sigma factor [Phycisphaerales bacterium]
MTNPGTITALVNRLSAGELLSRDEMFPLVYAELRGMARHRLRSGPADRTPTELVNMVYVKLFGSPPPGAAASGGPGRWENRAHFFGAAARAMEHLLVDDARRARTQRKNLGPQAQGGSTGGFDLDSIPVEPDDKTAKDIELLSIALRELEATDAELAELVRLRIFLRQSPEVIADAVQMSVRKLQRELACARAFLQNRLRQMGVDDPEKFVQ